MLWFTIYLNSSLQLNFEQLYGKIFYHNACIIFRCIYTPIISRDWNHQIYKELL